MWSVSNQVQKHVNNDFFNYAYNFSTVIVKLELLHIYNEHSFLYIWAPAPEELSAHPCTLIKNIAYFSGVIILRTKIWVSYLSKQWAR